MRSALLNDHRQSLWKTISKRNVYLWGGGHQGRGMCRILERRGVHLSGFLDINPKLQGCEVSGYQIFSPEKILGEGAGKNDELRPFVIIASFFFQEDIMRHCRTFGLHDGIDFISYKELKPYDYAIDISGACNLRCISCPRASRHDRHPPAGFMTTSTFEQVLDKILREDPLVGNIQLYQWGEPLLNPQLPAILKIAHSRGVSCAVSSNLNVNRDLAPVIEEGPDWFRISVSGVGKEYEQTHTGASWPKLLANMESLANLRASHKPDMKTEVYYHLYLHNQTQSLDEMRALCARLGFDFHPVWAYLISLDDVLEYLEGGHLSSEAQKATEMLALSLDRGMELARSERDKECLVDRCIHINWNLEVSNCMMFFYPQDNIAAVNFLETTLDEIQAVRLSSSLCRRCRAQALHRYCSVYTTEQVKAVSVNQ